MQNQDRLTRYAALALFVAVVLFAVWIWLSGGLDRPSEQMEPIETAERGTILQRDAETGEILWEVLTGEVEREAGSPTGVVRRATCRIYTAGRQEMMVEASALEFDAAEGVLIFTEGVQAESGSDAEVPYAGQAERMIYRTEERHARFEEEAVFEYGRSTFYGSTIDTWFEPSEGTDSTKLSRCEVTPMPPQNGKRAAIAVLAMATLAAGAQAQQEVDFRNAIVRADRMTADLANSVIRLMGDPEVEVGEAVFSADVINVQIDPEQSDQILYADTVGDVQVRSVHVIDPGRPGLTFRKERVITLTARSGKYSAIERQAVLEGGVRGVMERPRIEDSTFEASRMVADFDETGTITSVTATGAPTTLHHFQPKEDGPPTELMVYGSAIQYELTDPPVMTASGNPRIERPSAGDVYRADRIVARFVRTEPREPSASDEDEEEGNQPDVLLDRVELVGNAVLESRVESGDNRFWFQIRGGSATARLAQDEMRIEVRGEPVLVGKDPSTGEETLRMAADTIDVMPDEDKILAEGNVRVTSTEDSMVTTADRAEMDGSEAVGRMRLELSGNVHSEIEPQTKADRPMVVDGAAMGYHKPDSDHTWLYLRDGTLRILPVEDDQDEIVLHAKSLRMDRKSGQLEATERPRIVQGDGSFEADRVEMKLDPDTNELLGGIARGNVTFHTRVEQEPAEDAEDEEPRVRLVDGHAARAVLTPQVPVPVHVPGVPPGERADRVRMEGDPELVVIDERTGQAVMQFRNVSYIDIYSVGGSSFIDAGGAGGGPAEIIVSDDTDDAAGDDQ
jgi:lipopolysaccharide export system protein LptA